MPTSACARVGASLVPPPVIATSLPLACSLLMSVILSVELASARNSSQSAWRAMAVQHHVLAQEARRPVSVSPMYAPAVAMSITLFRLGYPPAADGGQAYMDTTCRADLLCLSS